MTTVKFYKVGGCVRDELLKRQWNDIDYCIEAPSYSAMILALGERNIEIIYEKEKFLTVRGRHQNVVCDFVLCRQDGNYHNSIRPENVIMGTLLHDLNRRDFTINAVAQGEDGSYIDPHQGRHDIQNRILRCVGSVDRLKEDPVRIIRAIRFLVTLDNFKFDSDLELALQRWDIISGLLNVPIERIREELFKCFSSNTHLTLTILLQYPLVSEVCFKHLNLWLKPTIQN